jgi:hypothetical protein
VKVDMSTDPDQIRAQVAALLADLPSVVPGETATGDGYADLDLDDVADRLGQAHDVLVRALESVEKG